MWKLETEKKGLTNDLGVTFQKWVGKNWTLCPGLFLGKENVWFGLAAKRVAYPLSRGTSLARNQTRVSCIAGGFFTSSATIGYTPIQNKKFKRKKIIFNMEKTFYLANSNWNSQ